ncbi:MAG: hypothetical protein NUV51_03700 [Sulfuricaulis sp.]|nr:hypothetical protein [Sulfuricaulis sp.]
MMYPTIHSNGTGKQALIDGLCSACAAINDALAAVTEAQPNGRDYYVQGDDATRKAIAEHQQRIDALLGVRNELMAIAEHIDES